MLNNRGISMLLFCIECYLCANLFFQPVFLFLFVTLCQKRRRFDEDVTNFFPSTLFHPHRTISFTFRPALEAHPCILFIIISVQSVCTLLKNGVLNFTFLFEKNYAFSKENEVFFKKINVFN